MLLNSHDYVFHEGSQLVSSAFDISPSQPFPMAVKIEHCVELKSDDEAKKMGMSFIKKADSSGGPPYIFNRLDGGSFKNGTYYGEIEVSHFTTFGRNRLLNLFFWG